MLNLRPRFLTKRGVCALVCVGCLFLPSRVAGQTADPPAATNASEGHRITVIVLDAATERPIPGARLSIRAMRERSTAEADGEGRYVAHLPESATSSWGIQATFPGYVGKQSAAGFGPEQTPVPPPSSLTLRLHRAETLRGKVADASGQPVPDVKITIHCRGSMSADGSPWIFDEFSASTDADGVFELACWPTTGLDGVESFTMTLDHPAHLPERLGWSRELDPQSLRSQRQKVFLTDLLAGYGEFRIEPDRRTPVRVAGRVTDAGGQAVAGARVRVASGGSTTAGAVETETDAEGTFSVEFMPAREAEVSDKARVVVEKPGYAAQVEVARLATAGDLRISLTPTSPIRGVVLDAESRPIEGARVGLNRMGQMSPTGWHWSATTGADGTFECAFPAEGVNLTVSKTGLQVYRSLSPVRGELIRVMLGPKAYVEGRVTQRSDGSAVPAFRVMTGQVSAQGAVYWPDARGSTGQPVFRDGVYRIEMPVPSSNNDAFRLRIVAEGLRPVESPVMRSGPQTVRWDVELEPLGRYVGRVVDSSGAAVPEVTIYGWVGDLSDSVFIRDFEIQKGHLSRGARVHTARTDDGGTFELPHEDDLGVLIAVHHAGWSVVHRPAVEAGDLMLSPWGRIEGRMYKGSVPDANRRMTTWATAPQAERSVQVSFAFDTECDSEGRFRLRALPGENLVSALTWHEEVRHGRYTTPGGFRPAWTARVQVQPGESAGVEFGLGGRTVTGRILGYGGNEALRPSSFSLVRVFPKHPTNAQNADGSYNKEVLAEWYESAEVQEHLKKQNQYHVSPDATGRFQVEGVTPGDYFLSGALIDIEEPSRDAARSDRERVYTIPEVGDASPVDLGDIALLPPSESETAGKGTTVGQLAPDFTVTTLDGRSVRLSDLRGKVVVLDFWATWCGPCLRQVPFLTEVQSRFGAQADFVMLGLSLDRSIDELKRGVDEHKLTWRQALLEGESGEAIKKNYGIRGIPHLVVIGRDGMIEGNNVFGEWLATSVEAAMAKKP
ncbi:MAG: carboxypeptidase regulatory-like domain-containing protein [Phycisphaerae bacterium]|nr:MAG: hypothetical protein EDS66_08465 [Planctomycetota bacterium]KAB2950235.1 MAG: redoxin domain-containing protein [Phycisphaerae bacterium]MBE7456159.1 carboxypeptidase regulatory-like domain-containing protein [Planctomycetia bacterium]MCK6466000.1 carboxypeptidase regulatory-like domain-containing protein [Phycisphaerae bacterium]MCL4718536.1 carboxypeptidase regulatory-like domain-containing protein [Phycisphaerae bacterium]